MRVCWVRMLLRFIECSHSMLLKLGQTKRKLRRVSQGKRKRRLLEDWVQSSDDSTECSLRVGTFGWLKFLVKLDLDEWNLSRLSRLWLNVWGEVCDVAKIEYVPVQFQGLSTVGYRPVVDTQQNNRRPKHLEFASVLLADERERERERVWEIRDSRRP